ncbi:MAG: Wzz/FepE/Etk N-terminal domain-containing protein, partial [Gammaproteobacteria bacterium]|nr:Wzz/FepE/Etk N-terminal domain-containing protein [Gammaproteobacteria bacterium]
MEANEYGLRDYVAVLRRRKNLLLLTFLGLMVLSILVAFLWPPTYRSTATILIRDQEIPRDLVPSTITSFADQRLMEIQARVVTSANMARLIDDFNLYPEERKRLPMTEIVEDMRADYSLDLVSADVIDPRTGRPTQATILFTVSFDYESPAIAQQVANRLVNLYLNENLRDRTERAQETTSFLSEQSDKLDREIDQHEARLARFKEQNGGALPELMSLNLQMMDRTESEMREIERKLQALGERDIFIEAQLATQSPDGPLQTQQGTVLPPNEQLRALQSQYTRLSATYGANHPDVVVVRRQIQALEGEVGDIDLASLESEAQSVYVELSQTKERYGASHPDVLRLERQYERLVAERDAALAAAANAVDSPWSDDENGPTNPAYITLQTQLAASEAEAQSLRARHTQLE